MVEVTGLTKKFGSQIAVDDISFTAKPGEILGFLGPNGAGKSTTMKMITSYLTQDSGSIRVCGTDPTVDPILIKSKIGYLPEHNPLYVDMYVKEYLEFAGQIHRLTDISRRIKTVIDQTGLEKEQHKIIGTLSKGYKQRVGLAQALLHDPDVLILDEPTSGLDMNQLIDIRALIKELGSTKTVIFSTHIMQEVQALCDRVVIINDGKLVADDPIESLQNRIKGENVIHLTFLNPSFKEQDFLSIEGVQKVETNGINLKVFSSQSLDLRPAVFDLAADRKWTIIEMKQEQISVEYIFQKLTKSTPNV